MTAYCFTCREPRDVPLDRSVRNCGDCGGRLSAPPKERKPMGRSRGQKPSKPTRRSPIEQTLAAVWHRIGRQKNGGFCVRVDCDAPAGEFAHHILEQRTLKRLGLEGHLFDDANSAPCCWPHNESHSNGGSKTSRITRDDLIATGLWAPVVAWATDLDARYFPGRQPVLSRLERDYPVVAG
jgi:hypothetical protein